MYSGARGTERPSSPTATEREYPNSVDEPETTRVHNPTGEPAVTSSARSPERDYTSSGEKEPSASWAYEDWLVRSPSERDALAFSPGAKGVEAAKAFVAETDLSEETVFVRQYRIAECISVALEQIKWAEDRDGRFALRLEYSDALQENCEHETTHTTDSATSKDVEAIIARIPVDVGEVKTLAIMS